VNIVLHPARASRVPRHQPPSRPKNPSNSAQPVSFLQLAHSLRRFSTPSPLFSTACTLFPKNTRVGATQFTNRHRSSLQISPLCFHTLTNCFSHNSFVLKTICVAPWYFADFVSPSPVCVHADSLASSSTLPYPIAQSLHRSAPSKGPLQSAVCATSPLPRVSKPAAHRLLLSFSQPSAYPTGPCRANGVNCFSFRNDHGSAPKTSSKN